MPHRKAEYFPRLSTTLFCVISFKLIGISSVLFAGFIYIFQLYSILAFNNAEFLHINFDTLSLYNSFFFATIRTARTKRANYIVSISHMIIDIFPYFWCRFKRNDTESVFTGSESFYYHSVLQISQIFLIFLSVFPLFYTNRQLILFFAF